MRDLLLFALLAFVVIRTPTAPYIGALAWVLFGVMNPHRLSWGMAFSFPFAQIIAIVLLTSLLFWRGHKEVKGGAAGGVLLVLLLWCGITTVFAINQDTAIDYLFRVLKTFLMTWVILLILHTRRHVDLLLWTLVVAVGFYSVKGGLFTLATGGAYRVNGPPGGVIEGNNSLAVGVVATIPLMYYLLSQARQKWLKLALAGSIALSAVSVLGSHSRGALLAILAMGVVLWWRGKNKLLLAGAAIAFVMAAIPFMPEHWTARMETIETYREDASAMGRIIAWETAYNIAVSRFPLGGGFEWQGPLAASLYSPDPTLVLVPHSIYFEVLGTQGFIGLALYLTFWAFVWRQCTWMRKTGKSDARFAWARSLGSMVQVSICGYAVGGAFLNLAFWEYCYYLFGAVAVAKYVVQTELRTSPSEAEAPARAHHAAGSKEPTVPV
jgi:putative inorganic carbon (HCO3(-)) transporter